MIHLFPQQSLTKGLSVDGTTNADDAIDEDARRVDVVGVQPPGPMIVMPSKIRPASASCAALRAFEGVYERRIEKRTVRKLEGAI